MQHIGTVCTVDSDGKLVIPKEVADLLHISHNDRFEVEVDDQNNICLKRCSILQSRSDKIQMFVTSLSKMIGATILVCDKSVVTNCATVQRTRSFGYTSSPQFNYRFTAIDPQIITLYSKLSPYIQRTEDPLIYPVQQCHKDAVKVLVPIRYRGKGIGALIALDDCNSCVNVTDWVQLMQWAAYLIQHECDTDE